MGSDTDKQDAGGRSIRRRIRSYVIRAGRLTAGQRRALEQLWPVHGVESGTGILNFAELFGNSAPVTLEIGFGNGDNLVAMAAAAPEQNFLGIEVHEPGVGHCLLGIEAAGLSNVRVLRNDAVEVLENRIADESLERVNLFFPDPWHKKRHHKRRIVQPDFVALLGRKLLPGGVFHVATDWPDYAAHIDSVLAKSEIFEPMQDAPVDRIQTRFDTRGQKLGHENTERAWCKRSVN
jgi:tRNA (guanine-N7-)-methyltransferase